MVIRDVQYIVQSSSFIQFSESKKGQFIRTKNYNSPYGQKGLYLEPACGRQALNFCDRPLFALESH